MWDGRFWASATTEYNDMCCHGSCTFARERFDVVHNNKFTPDDDFCLTNPNMSMSNIDMLGSSLACYWGQLTSQILYTIGLQCSSSLYECENTFCVYNIGYDDTGALTEFDDNAFIGVDNWYGEIKDFTIETNSCSAVCGHYTQVQNTLVLLVELR